MAIKATQKDIDRAADIKEDLTDVVDHTYKKLPDDGKYIIEFLILKIAQLENKIKDMES